MNVDFIIVGAMKAGTSSLGFYLNNHPDIYLPENELQFFNDDAQYGKGNAYYLSLFKSDGEIVIGEKTPTYSYQENVVDRIYKFNPNIKLIWILRNPVDRAYSNYLHAVKNGSELLSFDEAVEKEHVRIKSDIWKGYMERSIYVKQINRYLKRFPIEQMHFLLFEDLVENPNHVLTSVFNFLGVDCDKYHHEDQKRNKTVLPRSKKLLYFSKKILGSKSFLFKVIKKINILGLRPGYPRLSIERKTELNEFFKKHNKKLEELTNLSLSIWGRK